MGILAGKNNVQIREFYDDFLILSQFPFKDTIVPF